MDDLDKIRTRSKEFIGTLIRRSMKKYDKKEDLINSEDANLINSFLIKVRSELKNNNNK